MVEFEDLGSVSSNVASLLRKNEINTVESLAMQTFEQLKQILKGVSHVQIREMQEEAWKKTGYWFIPASKLEELKTKPITLPTGCKALDEVLGGGVRTRSITEFAGEFGSGKTECLLTLLIETLAKNTEYTALYFDTEEAFTEARASEIARTREYNPQEILDRALHISIWHTDHLLTSVRKADSLIKDRNVKIVLVDSIIATLRAEYPGREVLWERQQNLNVVLRLLMNYAKAFNLAVCVSNQVVANPQAVYTMDPTQTDKPAGGHIIGHGAETRLYLRKSSQGNRRIARLIDSSWLPVRECVFQISEKGVEDVSDENRQET